MPYDRECYRLAEHFLPDNIPEHIKEKLAEEIQTNIEDFIQYGEHSALITGCEEVERMRRWNLKGVPM